VVPGCNDTGGNGEPDLPTDAWAIEGVTPTKPSSFSSRRAFDRYDVRSLRRRTQGDHRDRTTNVGNGVADRYPAFGAVVTHFVTYPAVMGVARSAATTVVVSLLFAGVLSGWTFTPTPAASVTPTSASATSSAPPATQGLRGYGVTSLDCPTKAPPSTQDRPLQLVTGEVEEYVLCPYAWGTRQPHGVAHVVTHGSDAFAILDRALRRPDKEFGSGQYCPYAQLRRTILAQTTDGEWDVHIPTDDCGYYQAGVRRVLVQVDRER